MNRGLKILLGSIVIISLAGCWNGENIHVNLGSVSIGQQLLDLKAAADEGAMSEQEYQVARQKILSLVHGCGGGDDDSDSD